MYKPAELFNGSAGYFILFTYPELFLNINEKSSRCRSRRSEPYWKIYFTKSCVPGDMDSRQYSRIRPLMQKLTDAEGDLRATPDDAGRAELDAFANANMDLNLLIMKLSFYMDYFDCQEH